MKLVLIESPWKASNAVEQVRNSNYARNAMMDCIARGEAPFASHLLYTQVLNESIPEERSTGIEIGLLWGKYASKTVVYDDFGITSGMYFGIKRAMSEQREIEYRSIPGVCEILNPSLHVLCKEVCEFFGINFRTISSTARQEEIVIPRHVYFKVAREMFPSASLKTIGSVVCRDHATVMNGIRQIKFKHHIHAAYEKYCIAKDLKFD